MKGWSKYLFTFLLIFFSVTVIITMNFFKNNFSVIAQPIPDKSMFDDVNEYYQWAIPAIEYLNSRGIITGVSQKQFAPQQYVTKEQLAKMVHLCFDIPLGTNSVKNFNDVDYDSWSYQYIEASKSFFEHDINFYPEKQLTREELASVVIKAAGHDELMDFDILDKNFIDVSSISPKFKKDLSIAVEKGFLTGYDNFIKPHEYVTRAETAVILHRMIESRLTPIINKPTVSVERAKEWAKSRNAAQIYVDIADLYWKYGELTGINPEILYCQAAKETAFGRYTGIVVAEQHNWAGIKRMGATGDAVMDHESFDSAEDGVRAHFNHIGAYIGLEPIGEPHGRYFSVKTLSWAGNIKYVEELGGKWAPDLNYGYSIKKDYIDSLIHKN